MQRTLKKYLKINSYLFDFSTTHFLTFYNIHTHAYMFSKSTGEKYYYYVKIIVLYVHISVFSF